MNHRRIYILAISLFCLILGIVSFPPLWSSFWADSEIWATATSRLLWVRSRDFDFFSKPLFHFALWLSDVVIPFHHADDGLNLIGSLLRNRMMMMINLGVTLISVAWIVRQYTKSWIAGILAPAILLSSTFFFEQALRIRSDLLSIPLVLWAIYFTIQRRPFLTTALAVGAFWITPKTALVSIFLLPLAWKNQTLRRATTVLTVVFASLIVLQGAELFQAAGHFLNEGRESQMGFSYFSPIRWTYVLQAWEKDPWLWGIIGLMLPNWIFVIWRDRNWWRWETVTLVVLTSLSLNPSKLPFLIASYYPIFVVPVVATFSRWTEWRIPYLAQQPYWKQILWILAPTLALSFVLGTLIQKRQSQKPDFANQDQIWLAHELSTYAQKFPQASLYDGIGLLTDRELSSFFIGPGQREQNAKFLDYLKSAKPSWIAETQKVALLRGRIDSYLNDNYVESPSGLWRKAAQIRSANSSELQAEILTQVREQFPFEVYANTRLYFVVKNADGKEVVSPWQKLNATSIDHFAQTRQDELPDLPKSDRLFVTPYPPLESALNRLFIDAYRFQR